MDMAAAVAQHELEQVTERSSSNLIHILIMPAGREIPNDGFLDYRVVTSVSEAVSVPEGTVLVFGEPEVRLLSMIVDNADLFGYSMKILAGVPEVTYGQWWDTTTWKLEKISYPAFISELSLEGQLASERKKSNMTKGDRERAQVTRADGTVKDFVDYDLVGTDNGDD